jgi:hypothetical protein
MSNLKHNLKLSVEDLGRLLRERPSRKKLIDADSFMNGRRFYIISRRDFHNFVRELVRRFVIPRAINDRLELKSFFPIQKL